MKQRKYRKYQANKSYFSRPAMYRRFYQSVEHCIKLGRYELANSSGYGREYSVQ